MALLKFKGVAELDAHLTEIAKMDDVKEIILKNTVSMTRGAKRNAPFDTGFLKSDIEMFIDNGGMTGRTISYAEYSDYVEFGTRYMSAQPFLGPAFEKASKQMQRDMKRLTK